MPQRYGPVIRAVRVERRCELALPLVVIVNPEFGELEE